MANISVSLSEKDILKNINEKYRSFFNIHPVRFVQSEHQVFKNFVEAVNILCKFIDINKKVDIHFISTENPIFNADGTLISFQFRNDGIHMTYNSSIFLNTHISKEYPDELQIAAYLEELLHFFMNIKDEHLVKQVLAIMYPVVKYDPTTMDAYSHEH